MQALSDIDLDVERGEFVSLIGPSGCGKTTLLRVIADLEQPTGGSITVNGVSPEEARLKRAYGYVFQAPALYPWRTIARNVALPLEIMGLDRSERERRVAANLALVNLTGFERKFPWQLSGGMQQRASIARALAVEPDLLLMDEPFGALDEIVRDHLNEQLLKLWAKTEQDRDLRHPLDPRGGVPVDPDRRHVAAARQASTTSSTRPCRASAPSTFARRRNSSRSPTASARASAPGTAMRIEVQRTPAIARREWRPTG